MCRLAKYAFLKSHLSALHHCVAHSGNLSLVTIESLVRGRLEVSSWTRAQTVDIVLLHTAIPTTEFQCTRQDPRMMAIKVAIPRLSHPRVSTELRSLGNR
jgi:hypothetical protein